MKVIKMAALAVSALSLVATPVVASAAPAAQKLSLSNAVGARAGATSTRANKAAGGGFLIAILAGAVAIGGLAAAGVFDGKKAKSG